MAKRHYIPITADVPGVNEGQRAFIRKVIRTALAAEGVDFPCEVDVLLTNDEAIHQINLDMREVDRATDVLSFPEFDLQPGELPDGKPSGLREAMRVLKKVEGIGICELTNADVVRHVMVQRIVKAYEEYETAKNGGKGKK